MTGHARNCRLTGVFAVILVLGGILASCGENQLIPSGGPSVVSVPAPQVTMPPGARMPGALPSPTPRVPEAIVFVTPFVAPVTPPVVSRSEGTDKKPTPVPTPAIVLTGQAEDGRRQFAAMGCVGCHKADLSGDAGPGLAGRTPQDLTDDRIHQQIMHGGNGMPSFPDTTTKELQNYIALIRSFQ